MRYCNRERLLATDLPQGPERATLPAYLVVGRRDCTPLLDVLGNQVVAVCAALAAARREVPVHGVLCFEDADWPLLGGDLTARRFRVLSPKKLQRRLAPLADVSSGAIEAVHGALADALPPV